MVSAGGKPPNAPAVWHPQHVSEADVRLGYSPAFRPGTRRAGDRSLNEGEEV